MPGSASACSSSACSLTRSASRSNTERTFLKDSGHGRAGARETDPGSARLLLGGLLVGGLLAGGLAEALLEPRDATTGVQDLLLARVERVAVRADVGVDRAAGSGAPGGERVPAATGHGGDVVLGVNVSLHRQTPAFGGRRVAPLLPAEREPVPHGFGF